MSSDALDGRSYSSAKNSNPCAFAYCSASEREAHCSHRIEWSGLGESDSKRSIQTGPTRSPSSFSSSHFQTTRVLGMPNLYQPMSAVGLIEEQQFACQAFRNVS